MKAIWRGTILAESDETRVVEGNHYFPSESVRRQHFKASDKHTVCPWKGTASYHTIVVEGAENRDAAWYYPETKAEAKHIEGYVAFWRGVEVIP